jgi:hypothetical protein
MDAIVPTTPLPENAVVRVSGGSFDPARFAEVQEMTIATSRYLIPAVEALPGLISFFAGTHPDGSLVQISVWDSEEHARQLDDLREMAVIARGEAEKAGVTFMKIFNYPIVWSI